MPSLITRLGLTFAFLLGTACVGGGSGGESGADDPLGASLGVEPDPVAPGARLRLRLDVTNRSDTTVSLDFTSGQRFDFALRRGDEDVARWSADRSFVQILGTEAYPASETRVYEGSLTAPSEPGDYTAVGWLTSPGARVRDSVALTVR
ncbi:MAG TPA: BsuPI-related putative proteinase inhibitor [Longimicrobiales bacterium]|nr:BsuPI-related putative proteinase inhibitor [Longimicrobiales bacterium]